MTDEATMSGEEVGRWSCAKCGQSIVAAGFRAKGFVGIGAFVGPCPWGCGAFINRGFRGIKPGAVRAYRSDEWDGRGSSPST
jgi:hypothetical protein